VAHRAETKSLLTATQIADVLLCRHLRGFGRTNGQIPGINAGAIIRRRFATEAETSQYSCVESQIACTKYPKGIAFSRQVGTEYRLNAKM
jgi:hypothetical protein